MNVPPVWRSLLFLPAHNDKFVESAHKWGADAYILDLEDSVPIELKELARKNVKTAALTVAQDGADVLVRVNSRLRLAIRDLEYAVSHAVKAIVLPKVISAAQVNLLAEVIEELEVEQNIQVGHTGIIAQIEDVRAMPFLDDIASSSPRLLGMTIGSEDFAASAGMQPISEALFAPNQQLLMACRRANILPLGFPASIADYSDMESFKTTIELARKLGFVGAFCVHPSQVTVLNEGFIPSVQEVLHAQKLVETSEIQAKQGKAVFQFKGKMIDAPVIARAKSLLNRVRS